MFLFYILIYTWRIEEIILVNKLFFADSDRMKVKMNWVRKNSLGRKPDRFRNKPVRLKDGSNFVAR